MILARTMATGLLMLGATATAGAADHCLTRAEQRAQAAAHAVVPLSLVIARVKDHGSVIGARLCERGGKLVYLLTVLGRDGKVARTSVDAANGEGQHEAGK